MGSDEGVSPENLLAFDREENLRQFEQKYLLNPVNKPNNERLKLIIDNVINSKYIQKDDLTIVVVDSK